MATAFEAALRRELVGLLQPGDRTDAQLKATIRPGQRYRHGWIPLAGLDLLGNSHTNEYLSDLYGDGVDSEEFSPGAFVELGSNGTIHIDLAGKDEDRYHIFADMDQDDGGADALGDAIDWALDAKPGSRAPDPVNGLVDWRDDDGVIVGYTPDGDVRIGWPAGDDDVTVLDLPADEARVLMHKLWEFARRALPDAEEE